MNNNVTPVPSQSALRELANRTVAEHRNHGDHRAINGNVPGHLVWPAPMRALRSSSLSLYSLSPATLSRKITWVERRPGFEFGMAGTAGELLGEALWLSEHHPEVANWNQGVRGGGYEAVVESLGDLVLTVAAIGMHPPVRDDAGPDAWFERKTTAYPSGLWVPHPDPEFNALLLAGMRPLMRAWLAAAKIVKLLAASPPSIATCAQAVIGCHQAFHDLSQALVTWAASAGVGARRNLGGPDTWNPAGRGLPDEATVERRGNRTTHRPDWAEDLAELLRREREARNHRNYKVPALGLDWSEGSCVPRVKAAFRGAGSRDEEIVTRTRELIAYAKKF